MFGFNKDNVLKFIRLGCLTTAEGAAPVSEATTAFTDGAEKAPSFTETVEDSASPFGTSGLDEDISLVKSFDGLLGSRVCSTFCCMLLQSASIDSTSCC